MASRTGTLKQNPPCPAISQRAGTLHDGQHAADNALLPTNKNILQKGWLLVCVTQAISLPLLSLDQCLEQVLSVGKVSQSVNDAKRFLSECWDLEVKGIYPFFKSN